VAELEARTGPLGCAGAGIWIGKIGKLVRISNIREGRNFDCHGRTRVGLG
jgi:hypothetical protein